MLTGDPMIFEIFSWLKISRSQSLFKFNFLNDTEKTQLESYVQSPANRSKTTQFNSSVFNRVGSNFLTGVSRPLQMPVRFFLKFSFGTYKSGSCLRPSSHSFKEFSIPVCKSVDVTLYFDDNQLWYLCCAARGRVTMNPWSGLNVRENWCTWNQSKQLSYIMTVCVDYRDRVELSPPICQMSATTWQVSKSQSHAPNASHFFRKLSDARTWRDNTLLVGLYILNWQQVYTDDRTTMQYYDISDCHN